MIKGRLKLVADWRLVLRRAWSIRLILIAGLLSGAEAIIPFLDSVVSRRTFALVSFIVVMGAFVSRLLAQKDFDGQ